MLTTRVSLRSIVWLAIAAMLASAVLMDPHTAIPRGILVLAGAGIMVALVAGAGWPVLRPRPDDAAALDRDVRVRLEELEARTFDELRLEQRLVELENRLDFAERLLAERSAAKELTTSKK